MSDFTRAAAALHHAGEDDDLCEPFLSALPVAGVAISTLGDPFGSETICASDPTVARLDEIQLDLGEGPSWHAMRTGEAVLQPDLHGSSDDRWPMASAAFKETGAAAAFAFPMRLGTLEIGAVHLWCDRSEALPAAAVRVAGSLSEGAARQALRRALTAAAAHEDGADPDAGQWSRREVYQASGMLIAQTGVAPVDALLILRGHAYASGRSLRDLSEAVMARTVDFTDRDDPAPTGTKDHP